MNIIGLIKTKDNNMMIVGNKFILEIAGTIFMRCYFVDFFDEKVVAIAKAIASFRPNSR